MTALDQTAHFVNSARFDMHADARILRAGTDALWPRLDLRAPRIVSRSRWWSCAYAVE
jgi:hypothetical protein